MEYDYSNINNANKLWQKEISCMINRNILFDKYLYKHNINICLQSLDRYNMKYN